MQNENIGPLKMSSSLLKSSTPDDIEIALALSMNGRLTDYKSDVEHRQLMIDHHHSNNYRTTTTTTTTTTTDNQYDSNFQSRPHSSSFASSSASVLHYLPSSSSNDEIKGQDQEQE